jgi:hypothetical protein
MFQFIKKEKRKPKPIPWNFLGTKINEFLLEPTVRPTLVRPTQPSDLEIPTKLTNGHFLPFPSLKSFLCLYVRVQKYSDSISNGINSLHLQPPGVSFFFGHIGGFWEK